MPAKESKLAFDKKVARAKATKPTQKKVPDTRDSNSRIASNGSISKVSSASISATSKPDDAKGKRVELLNQALRGKDTTDRDDSESDAEERPYKPSQLHRESTKDEFELRKKVAKRVVRNLSPNAIYQGISNFNDMDGIKAEINRVEKLIWAGRAESRLLMSRYMNSLEAELEELRTIEETLRGRQRRVNSSDETAYGAVAYQPARRFRNLARRVFKLSDRHMKKDITEEIEAVSKMVETRIEKQEKALEKEQKRDPTTDTAKLENKVTAAKMCKEAVDSLYRAVHDRIGL